MKPLLIACLTCCLAAAAADPMQPARVKFEVQENIAITNTLVAIPALHVQHGNAPLTVAADAFAVADLQDSTKRPLPIPDTGRYRITYGRLLRYDVRIATPGRYTGWILASFPLVANYNHGEQMDDGRAQNVCDSADGAGGYRPANFWHWCKGRTYDLTAGTHQWLFPAPHAWCGGARMETLLLIPEAADVPPENVDPQQTECRFAPTGLARSRRIKTLRIASWRVDCDRTPNGGRIDLEYSYDNQRYLSLEPGQVYEPAGDYLYLRLRLTKSPDAPVSPWVHNLKLMIAKKPKAPSGR